MPTRTQFLAAQLLLKLNERLRRPTHTSIHKLADEGHRQGVHLDHMPRKKR